VIRVLYFASLRERLRTTEETLTLQPEVRDVAALREHLARRGGDWAEALAADRSVLCAVNQAVARPGQRITDGDEVAFFPPVTGG
jgi:molybdopterin synthase sulfur carrier subunit